MIRMNGRPDSLASRRQYMRADSFPLAIGDHAREMPPYAGHEAGRCRSALTATGDTEVGRGLPRYISVLREAI